MIIEKIIIENFRNIEKIEIVPNEKTNYIVGDNAQGKTNILEGIYFGVFAKSFRTSDIQNLLGREKKLKIKFTINNSSVKNTIKLLYEEKSKKIFINDKEEKVKKISELLNVILYYPSEISLLLKFPSYRRNLIDKSIYLNNSNYIDYYNSYIKCLKNRNVCLKRGVDDYVWKEKLIELSCKIIKLRIEYINRINSYIRKINMYEEELYEIYYIKNNTDDLYKEISFQFKNAEERDRKNGYTSAGPHTDDIKFIINNKNLSFYGSEGQKKTFILLYKYAQLLDYKDNKNDYPVLLIDDLTSELDITRENFIINEILSNCSQSFLTTNYKPTSVNNSKSIFYVKNGQIS